MKNFITYRYRRLSIWLAYKEKPVPAWTTLRTLGQSRLLKLTVLVPFVGSLILFNQQFVDLISMSPHIIGKWTGNLSTTNEAQIFTLSRLHITYFGLVALGLASFLFGLLCPLEIKKYDSVSAYIEAEKPLITTARTSLLVSQVANDYHKYNPEDSFSLFDQLAYPPNITSRLFCKVIADIVNNSDLNEERKDVRDFLNRSPEENNLEKTFPLEEPFLIDTGVLDHRGDVNPDGVAKILSDYTRAYAAIYTSIEKQAVNHIIDLLTLQYLSLDYRRPLLRVFISVLYALGFTILSIPTIQTFALIFSRSIGY